MGRHVFRIDPTVLNDIYTSKYKKFNFKKENRDPEKTT